MSIVLQVILRKQKYWIGWKVLQVFRKNNTNVYSYSASNTIYRYTERPKISLPVVDCMLKYTNKNFSHINKTRIIIPLKRLIRLLFNTSQIIRHDYKKF